MKRVRPVASRSSAGRLHVVLVPGFAGFDALGQLEYFAGVTEQFQDWQQKRGRSGGRAVLHYFDNLPTAAVVTRAERLRRYLAKRVARGEFKPGDAVALVGHSTGGLDIRRLLRDLTPSSGKAIDVDGTVVKAPDLFHFLRRVVFLSVPQRGTNIADWVRLYALGRATLLAELRAAVAASQVPVVDNLENWVVDAATRFTDLNLVHAVRDALHEAEVAPGDRHPTRVADAHEAAAHLALWLRHMAWDFRAIDDLTSQRHAEDFGSPAHFTAEMREKEIAGWGQQIKTRSYATIGKPPFRFDPGGAAPLWDLSDLSTYPERVKDETLARDTDILYRICYRACAGGPFDQPFPMRASMLSVLDSQKRRMAPWRGTDRIAVWENDGIVNTDSMLWPDGKNTILVLADHMDIVGHYRMLKAPRTDHRRTERGVSGREFTVYDLLESGCGFRERDFAEVWSGIFDFCAGALEARN